MSFAAVLAAMPDLLARALAEHVPDDHGRCRECRADDGTSAPWPCAMRLLADEARGMINGSRNRTTVGSNGGPHRPPQHPSGPVRPLQPPHAPPHPAQRQQAPQRPHQPPQHPQHLETAPAPIVDAGPVTAPQPPVSDGWDPLADRRAFRRDRFTNLP
jgi:hypothetical protein